MNDFDIDACTSKDELEAYALAQFGVDIDKRKRMEQLREEVKAMATEKQEPMLMQAPPASPGLSTTIQDVDMPVSNLRYVKNKAGVVFLKTARLENWMKKGASGLVDCDEFGRLV